jgi:hypothetical protein
MGTCRGKHHELAQESLPDDLSQSPAFDPIEPEPIPEDDFDQSREA